MGKIITVWSHKSNMGTTLTSINVARELAKINDKVILVDFNFADPQILYYLNYEQDNLSIDNLIPFAMSQKLTEEVIKNNCVKEDKLFVLKGSKVPTTKDIATEESLRNLIYKLKEIFDYIILDASSFVRYSSTIVALSEGDIILTIANRNVFNIISLNTVGNEIFTLFGEDKFAVILNQEHGKNSLPDEDIKDTMDLNIIGNLPVIPDIDRTLNRGEFKDFTKKENKQNREYIARLDDIVQYLINME